MDINPVLIGSSRNPYREGSPVHIVPDARSKHMAVFGATGAGKSHLIRSMVASDILAGHGVTVVDPHGGFVAAIIANDIPKSRKEDVIFLDAKNRTRSLAINLLDAGRPEQRGLVVSNAIGILRTLHRDSWGPRMDDIFRNAFFALLEQPFPVSLIALPPLLTEPAFRADILRRVRTRRCSAFSTTPMTAGRTRSARSSRARF